MSGLRVKPGQMRSRIANRGRFTRGRISAIRIILGVLFISIFITYYVAITRSLPKLTQRTEAAETTKTLKETRVKAALAYTPSKQVAETPKILVKQQMQERENDRIIPIISADAHMEQRKHAFDSVDEVVMKRDEIEKLLGRPVYDTESQFAKDINKNSGELSNEDKKKRVLFIITPTYKRDTQMMDLSRLKQTIQAAQMAFGLSVYWLVVEDSETPTKRVRDLITLHSTFPYAHIAVKTSDEINEKEKKHRGIEQRNRALETIQSIGVEGVVYLADDDNAYDMRIFAELLRTRRVGLLPMGYLAGGPYERCVVDSEKEPHQVTGFRTHFALNIRKYPVDMGSMGVSTTLLVNKSPRLSPSSEPGFLETDFLELIIDDKSELEPLAADCTAILGWHVKTELVFSKNYIPFEEDADLLIENLV